MDEALAVIWTKWPLLALPSWPPETSQDALEPDQASHPQHPINGAAAVAAPNRQQQATPQLSAEYRCAECAGPIEGRRRGARFCSDSCRVKSAAKAFRQRKQRKAQATTGEDLPTGRGERTDLGKLPKLPRAARAASQGISRRQQQKLDAPLPADPERPFKEPYTSEEPDWLAEALKPPALAIEGWNRTPSAPKARTRSQKGADVLRFLGVLALMRG
jgi:hypothetical protein